jgi:hypothetical protein
LLAGGGGSPVLLDFELRWLILDAERFMSTRESQGIYLGGSRSRIWSIGGRRWRMAGGGELLAGVGDSRVLVIYFQQGKEREH